MSKATIILWSLYGGYLAYLVFGTVQSDLRLGYPAVVVALFATAHIANLVGLVAYIRGNASKRFRYLWRGVVPTSLLLVCASAALDNSRSPTDSTHDFLLVLAIFVASLAPAYFANFRVAYAAHG